MRICTILACVLLIATCDTIEAAEPSTPDYSMLAPCKRPEQANYANIYDNSLCGKLTVYENRASRQGRKIKLNIMVIRARLATPRPDPVFFLAGGPGQAATGIGPALFSILHAVRKNHDVVLVDQRGTGQSNSLACDTDDQSFADATLPLDTLEIQQVKTLRECLAHFQANPALYTTPIAMDDLNEVRKRLGYDKINLYGISYGTRAALVYMRRHGDTVRSAILDSVAPLTMSIPAKIAVDAQSAFDRLLADCKHQTACNRSFPHLKQHFQALLVRLRQHPEDVALAHPRTDQPIHLLIEARTLMRMVRGVLYDRTLSSLLPLALHDAWLGDFQPMVTLGFSIDSADKDFSVGMMASVLCSEDMRNTTGPDSTADFYNSVYSSIAPICKFWPKGQIPNDYFKPVKSNIPTLLLAGELDPVTPPKYAIEAAATLSDSQVVIVPGVGHTASIHGCVPRLLEEFLDKPTPHKLDTSCVTILKRPAFFTSPAGTAMPSDATHD